MGGAALRIQPAGARHVADDALGYGARGSGRRGGGHDLSDSQAHLSAARGRVALLAVGPSVLRRARGNRSLDARRQSWRRIADRDAHDLVRHCDFDGTVRSGRVSHRAANSDQHRRRSAVD